MPTIKPAQSAYRATIERALGSIEVAMTERPGHGIALARDGARAGHPLVVAVGGDRPPEVVADRFVEQRHVGRTAVDRGFGGHANDVRAFRSR